MGAPVARRSFMAVFLIALVVVLCNWLTLSAQTGPPAASPSAAPPYLAADAETLAEQPATLSLVNRPIVVFRAKVVGRNPAERASAAVRALDDLVSEGVVGPVEAQRFELGTVITVGSRSVFVLTPSDADRLSDQTLEALTAQTIARLTEALAEAKEARTPRQLLRGLGLTVVALIVAWLLLLGVARAQRWLISRLEPAAARRLARSGIVSGTPHQSRLLDIERRIVGFGSLATGLVVIYVTSTFILRRFPYTRPWGESMRGFLLDTIGTIGAEIIGAIPGLFTVVLIMLIARVLVRGINTWFRAVEEGRATARWVYPETALPTRRIVSLFVWLFAIVVAYPYMPGSRTDAFRGLSVFVGLLVSLGSSGLMNQLMSGFVITYSRAVRLNEFVRIGDSEGVVTHLGVLSTRIRTLRNEEITIPNAVVVGQTTVNYTRRAERVLTPTSVTIGYDTPWRQVHALLLGAAAVTPGIRDEPHPCVFQTSLDDFYVTYKLFVCLERQEDRLRVLGALHANIQDRFNEYGVQIMSPNYVLDPKARKLVPRDQWYAAPAQLDGAIQHATSESNAPEPAVR